jgi:hypothetical protein
MKNEKLKIRNKKGSSETDDPFFIIEYRVFFNAFTFSILILHSSFFISTRLAIAVQISW